MVNWPEQQIQVGTILKYSEPLTQGSIIAITSTFIVLSINGYNDITIMNVKTKERFEYDIDYLYERFTYESSEVGNLLYED